MGPGEDSAVSTVARQLGTYLWYRGDETVEEAMEAVRKIDGICAALMAMKRVGGRALLSWRIGR